MKYKIRQEKAGDEEPIRRLVDTAFAAMPFGDDNDQHIVGRLRDAGALVLSLVAVAQTEVIGQVALSPATIGTDKWLCLGPIAVHPDRQRKGIGRDLMQHALGVAQMYGREGVVLMGNPAYYSRFGFKQVAGVTYAGQGAEFVQVLPFGDTPSGEVRFHPAFDAGTGTNTDDGGGPGDDGGPSG